jgi:predicted transposase YbfD/YdcC
MTGNYQRLKQASHNFLRRMLRKPAWSFKRFVSDQRGRQGRRWGFEILLQSLLEGYLSNRSSLRAVERLTEIHRQRRVPDTTLYDFVSRFGEAEVAGLRRQLQAQVRSDWRSKSLAPVGVPCGVVAIDNKTVWSGSETSAPAAAQVVHPPERPAYAQLRMVRSVLISAASKPALDQVVIRPDTNECGMFSEVLASLEAAYGALVEVYSGDAAFCSEANARLVAKAGKGYIFGLKGNQRELWREATRVLGAETSAVVSTPWERYQGARVRYHLYRTTELAGYLDWEHLKQVWRIEKERVKQNGQVERENRYYVTNLHVGRFQPAQILQVVRAHWGIENNCNWTMDVVWDEDTKVWCGRGAAIQALSLLRLMAYNLVALWRCRYLRRREAQQREKRSWQEFFDLVLQIFSTGGKSFSIEQVTECS